MLSLVDEPYAIALPVHAAIAALNEQGVVLCDEHALAELRQQAKAGEAVATRCDWTVRCPEGDLGWWGGGSARRILARRRSHHPDDGPYELIRRTWRATDEVVDR